MRAFRPDKRSKFNAERRLLECGFPRVNISPSGSTVLTGRAIEREIGGAIWEWADECQKPTGTLGVSDGVAAAASTLRDGCISNAGEM